ncbi:MAG: DNA methyltransferase [Nitrososphaeraceae archaeon]
MINNKIKRQLDVIDWDFPTSQTGITKLHHWYPGTFPPQLPATLIQALTQPGDVVFDPYGGAGTTASEALRLGRKAWIVDINPIGILTNYSYCALLLLKEISIDKLNIFFKYIENFLFNKIDVIDFSDIDEEILNLDEFVSQYMRPIPYQLLNQIRLERIPNWNSLKKWIDPVTINELSDLLHKISDFTNSSFLKLFFYGMISANLRALCSQNKSWGHIADNVYPKTFIYKNVIAQLSKWVNLFRNNLMKVSVELPPIPNTICYWAEIKDWSSVNDLENLPPTGAKIIITSPPYGDAIDYIYAQKLSMYFLGYDDEKITRLCMQEIGARRKRFQPNSRNNWATQLADVAVKQSKFVINTGFYVTILPHKNHGREIGINMMKDSLKENGWSLVFERDRSINQKKTRQSWTSIKQETINIFLRA